LRATIASTGTEYTLFLPVSFFVCCPFFKVRGKEGRHLRSLRKNSISAGLTMNNSIKFIRCNLYFSVAGRAVNIKKGEDFGFRILHF
jgi:hypothetical protein